MTAPDAMMNPDFSLPLANAKNRQLQIQVREKRERLAKLLETHDQNGNKTSTIEQELVALEQSTIQTNNLCNSMRTQCWQERETIKLTENEVGAMEREKRRLREEMEQTLEQNKKQQKRLEDQSRDLEHLNQVIEEEAKIVQVMEEMVGSQKEDESMLDAFTKQDELKIKELEVKLTKVKDEAQESRRQLKASREERESTAIQLQRMQEEFRALIEDRNQSLQRWESTLNQMEACKFKMECSNKEFKYIKTLTWAETKKLEGKNTSIQQLQEEISSLERTFQTREHIAGQLSVKYSELEKQRDEMEMELQATELMSKRVVDEVEETTGMIAKQKEKMSQMEDKMAKEKKLIMDLEKKLQEFQGAVETAQSKKESLANMLKTEEERVARLRRQMEQLDNDGVKIEQEVRQTQSLIDTCTSELKGCTNALRNLENRVKETEKQIQYNEELIYHKNLEVLRTELELKALRSSIDDPELRQRQREQVEQLKIELDSSQSHLMGLKHELLKTQSDALGLQRGCDAQHQRKNLLVRQSAELDAECQRRERQCKELRRQVEEVRMEESLINLEIRRRENVLQLQSEAVDDLENQRQHIENVIRERWEELNRQTENLEIEVRSIRERTQQLVISVKQKSAEVERIKLRHEMIACTLVNEAGQSQEPSEAYFIIKLAQDKEMLKESIKEIEDSVSKLESDNAALGNTLRLVMSSNQQFRQHTIVGVLTDDDKAMKMKMEGESQRLELAVQNMRKEAKQLQYVIHGLEEEVQQLKKEAACVKSVREDKEFEEKEADDENNQLVKKTERSLLLCQQMQKNLRRARKTKHKTDEEVDFGICQMREHCASILALIRQIVAVDDEARAALDTYLDELPTVRQMEPNIVKIIRPNIPKMRLDITDFPRSTALPSSSRKSTGRSDRSVASTAKSSKVASQRSKGTAAAAAAAAAAPDASAVAQQKTKS